MTDAKGIRHLKLSQISDVEIGRALGKTIEEIAEELDLNVADVISVYKSQDKINVSGDKRSRWEK